MRKYFILIITFLFLGFFLINPVKVEAKEDVVVHHVLATQADADCQGKLGSVNDKDSVAYFLQQIFNIMKYLGPLFCLVFSVIDFVKAAASQDKEALSKAGKTTVKRVILAMALFFIPVLINYLFPLIGFYGTCDIG